MAIYLGGSEKLQVNIDDVKYFFKQFSEILITNGVRLLSSENYILKDSNDVYITAKEVD
jgi:hypothetical protein